MSETKTTIPDILIILFILIDLILVSLFLSFLLTKIGARVEDNALRRAATEIAETLIHSHLTEGGAFLVEKLNTLDATDTEPITHCYAYRSRISSSKPINKKNVWEFGYPGGGDDFSIDLPASVKSGTDVIPAKFELTVYDTTETRCK